MVSRSQKLMNRLRPLLNRLVGRAERNSSHRGSDWRGCRGRARTRAARKLEQRLLQVFRLRPCLAGRTALISGRMCRREGGVILGGCHVAAAPICGHDRGPRSVIDRLLKNQNHWKIAIIFGHPRRTLVLDRHLRNRAAILRSEIHRHGSHGCSDRRGSVRAFDDSTARRSAAAASRGPRLDASRARWRLRQPYHRL